MWSAKGFMGTSLQKVMGDPKKPGIFFPLIYSSTKISAIA